MNVVAVPPRIGRHTCRRRTRALLALIALFVGIGALYGGYELMTDAGGFGMKAAGLEGTPFPDYVIPGLFLSVVIGGGMLVVASLAIVGSGYAALSAFCWDSPFSDTWSSRRL